MDTEFQMTTTTSTNDCDGGSSSLDSGDDGPDTYTSAWDGKTFTEYVDPIERFERFSPTDPEGDQLVELEPLEPQGGSMVEEGSLADLNDSIISSEMSTFDLTDQDLKDSMERLMGEDPNASDTLNETLDLIDAHEYEQAGNNLLASDVPYVNVTIWCGQQLPATQYEWVLGIPARVDCNDDGNFDVGVWVQPWDVDHMDGDPIDGEVYLAVTQLNSTFHSHSLPGSEDLRVVEGFGYKGHHFGAETDMNKPWKIRMGMDNLEHSSVVTEGQINWTEDDALDIDTQPFYAGDGLIYTHEAEEGEETVLGRDISYTWTLGADERYVNTTKLEVQYPDQAEWMIESWIDDETSIKKTRGYIDLFEGGVELLEIRNPPRALNLEHRTYLGEDGEFVRDVFLANPTSDNGPFRDAEAKVTLRNGGSPQMTVGLVGMPTSDVTGKEYNVIRLDPGTAADNIPVADVSKNSQSIDGYYRTLAVTGHESGLAFNATASYTNRTQLFADPGASPPVVSQATTHHVPAQASEDHSFAKLNVTDPRLPAYLGKMSSKNQGALSTWGFQLGGECPGVACDGQLQEGEDATWTQTSDVTAPWWHIDDAGDEDSLNLYKGSQTSFENCRPGDGECPW